MMKRKETTIRETILDGMTLKLKKVEGQVIQEIFLDDIIIKMRELDHDDQATTDLYYIGGREVAIDGDGGEKIVFFPTIDKAAEFFYKGSINWGELSIPPVEETPISVPLRCGDKEVWSYIYDQLIKKKV